METIKGTSFNASHQLISAKIKAEAYNFRLKAKDFIDPSSFAPDQPVLRKRQI